MNETPQTHDHGTGKDGKPMKPHGFDSFGGMAATRCRECGHEEGHPIHAISASAATQQPALTEQEVGTLGYHAGRMALARALNTLPAGSPEHAALNAGWDKAANERANYADTMNKRDRERPQWERDAATGARDPDVNFYRGRTD